MSLHSLLGTGTDDPCGCTVSFEGDRLLLDATDCPGGDLATDPDCRATAIVALESRDAERVVVRAAGLERAYEDDAAALLVAAGRFADAAAFHDPVLAGRTRTDPLRAAADATARAGPVADLVAETGLALLADRAAGYEDALRPFSGPPVSKARIAASLPPGATLVATREARTDATVREYEDATGRRCYHLEPIESRLDEPALETLADAYAHLADGRIDGAARAPGRAVRAVADDAAPVETLTRILRKHTREYGVLTDLFGDPAVSDVFASAPVRETPLRVTAGGHTMPTNVRLTEAAAGALASRFRQESGRAFSRASPTLDATAEMAGDPVRVAGVTRPVSDGYGFAFRRNGRDAWTLPRLVAAGSLTAEAAGFLSLAVARAAAILVAGTRGAGKTTTLGALLWELPRQTRTVVIEDTPELPVSALQAGGRDVQALHTTTGDGPSVAPDEALRTALRLGEGALVVGEVRGEEARVLYEAMRVGASGSAVLGTIHGDGGADVRERVVADLGVPESSFGVTDLVVTCRPVETDTGTQRRVASIEEVRTGADGVHFESLFELDGTTLASTGRIDRGESALVASLAGPTETYADVRAALADRTDQLAALVADGRTDPADLPGEPC
ncbi:ATPase, T2SS/T4P/T4SS family [Haloarchaeobius sp. HME9146]|uniref:ATPase, T2SS/T4P/T4SS family n=1 Tax=Haloarchaeobius sp. HME9146 TaxID=2978732 RepID=UPI0021C0ECC7|nr:ATPase, T2SS/T4P/T4SS family [Haloarchaeobius sp. HME9146]MCT9095829.1 ATPase, T2SS/T4P/T4SS family [Haloarchaeobius sp. HME9146]